MSRLRSTGKKKLTKKTVSNIRMNHAITRAMERYGLKLGVDDYKELVRKINSDESVFLCNITNSKTVHVVELNGVAYYGIYTKTSKCIVTFIHKTWLVKSDEGWEFSKKYWNYHHRRYRKKQNKIYKRKMRGEYNG